MLVSVRNGHSSLSRPWGAKKEKEEEEYIDVTIHYLNVLLSL